MEEESGINGLGRMIYFKSDSIITSLGTTTRQNFENIFKGNIGISEITDHNIYYETFPASIIDSEILESLFTGIKTNDKTYTRLEKIMIR